MTKPCRTVATRETKTSISREVLGTALRTWLLASSYPREPSRKSSLSPSLARIRIGGFIRRVGVDAKGDLALSRKQINITCDSFNQNFFLCIVIYLFEKRKISLIIYDCDKPFISALRIPLTVTCYNLDQSFSLFLFFILDRCVCRLVISFSFLSKDRYIVSTLSQHENVQVKFQFRDKGLTKDETF